MLRALVFLSILIFYLPNQCFSESGNQKIGVSLPLSGGMASFGSDMRRAFELANQTIADNSYTLIFEDDQASPRQAVSVAQKLLTVDRVNYVLGFGSSSSLLAAGPLYQKAEVIAIGTTTSSPRVSQLGDYIFRASPNDLLASKLLYDFMQPRYKVIGVLAEETEYCEDLTNAFSKHAKEGETQLLIEHIHPDEVDFRSVLLRLRTQNPEALFLNTQSDSRLAEVVRRVREIGWEIDLYAAYFPSSSHFLSAVGTLAEGMTFYDVPDLSGDLTSEGQALLKQFRDRFGEPDSSELVVILALNAFIALHHAIESGEPVRQALANNQFPGVTGRFNFDQSGDIVGISHAIKRIKDGKVVELSG